MNADLDMIGTIVAFTLTLLVYSYLIKDIAFFHAIYRLVAYLFVGVSLGYAAVMAVHGVLGPRLLDHLRNGEWTWAYLVPLTLCVLLMTKLRRSWSSLGNVTIAFLFGVGAALAVGGGVIGTLIPQIEATFVSLNPFSPVYASQAAQDGQTTTWVYVLDALLIVVGTISTLLYFCFGTEKGSRFVTRLRDPVLRLATGFGKVFIMFTFGALFATTAISRISLLADRVRFIIVTIFAFAPDL
jgi:hypothetical protein